MPERDPRLTAARGDLAAASLKGIVEAQRYAEGRVVSVGVGVAALRARPNRASRLETQVLFGEAFTIYDAKDGWAWGQAALDGYVGYVEEHVFCSPVPEATHRVVARGSHTYVDPDVKAAAQMALPMGAKLAVRAVGSKFVELHSGWFVPLVQIEPVTAQVDDFVAVAEHVIGAPYLWGGRTGEGLDCSGLVQCALERAGVAALRDSDMQERTLGVEIEMAKGLRRGDLVFWSDHVGIMCDERLFVHANSHHMAVAKEPLQNVIERNLAKGSAVTSVRRLVAA